MSDGINFTFRSVTAKSHVFFLDSANWCGYDIFWELRKVDEGEPGPKAMKYIQRMPGKQSMQQT